MNRRTLFGYLATQFLSQSSENLATESLNYIFQNKVACSIFLKFIMQQIGVELTGDLVFHTQSSQEDKSRPDLVGKDFDGNQVIIIEAKFWAGLTPNQPVSYIKNLPEMKTGLVLFVAPEVRLLTIWAELVRRCKINGIDFINQPMQNSDTKIFIGQINEYHRLALISWRFLLDFIISRLENEGLREVASDAAQLLGLCNQMDTNAFLPISSEDLTPAIPKRIFQYMNLVDKVYSKLNYEGLATKSGLTKGKAFEYYVTYFQIADVTAGVGYFPSHWRDYRETPLWFTIWGDSAKICREKLAKLEFNEPSQLIINNKGDLFIPLFLSIGAEEDDVINDLVSQIKHTINLLENK